MRPEPNIRIESMRAKHPTLGEGESGKNFGYFEFRGLRIISSGSAEYPSDGPEGWEHVSVSRHDRCPTWDEMQWVKEMFWADDEVVVQYHPAKDRYVNRMPYCLHLWRKAGHVFELPPKQCL